MDYKNIKVTLSEQLPFLGGLVLGLVIYGTLITALVYS